LERIRDGFGAFFMPACFVSIAHARRASLLEHVRE
jgi:hypothetical protein